MNKPSKARMSFPTAEEINDHRIKIICGLLREGKSEEVWDTSRHGYNFDAEERFAGYQLYLKWLSVQRDK